MALEDRGAQHDKEVVDKFIDPAASVAMVTSDYVVRPSAMTAPMVIVLPPVAEAKGRFYSIVARHASAQNTITITHKDDSECWKDVVFTSKCDCVLFYSDGLKWYQLASILPNFPEGYDYDYSQQ
jgi:hypothetical protein